jgi:4-amino-4-deoxy-L-arabinose transferase-like glycosyltransferase
LFEATALAGLLGLAAWIFFLPLHSATNYDEGNYLAALTDLRHGFALGKDVYADQPPGWYALLQVCGAIFGNSVAGVRTGLVLLALAGVVAAWACARRFGAWPALGAAALLVIAPPYPGQASQIEADQPAAVLALAALACGVWAYRERGSRTLAVIGGALLACAVSVKLSALTAVLPFAAIAFGRRRVVGWSALGALAIVGGEALAFRRELGPIGRGAIGQHTSALSSGQWSRSANVHQLVHFLNWHTPFAWLVAAAAVGSIWLALDRTRGFRTLGAFWLFVPVVAAFVLAMKPLLGHHLVILAVALALPTGTALGLAAARLPRGAGGFVVLMAGAFVAAGTYQQHRQLVHPQAEPQWIFRAASWVRAKSQPDEIVASDIPIVAYYAHRRLVPDLVDSSFTRRSVGELTAAKVFDELDRYHVRVAAIGRVFWADPRIRAAFDARFRTRTIGTNIVEYLDRRGP